MGRSSAALHTDGFVSIAGRASVLGPAWVGMYATGEPPAATVPFEKSHFERAMLYLFREPNINSTAILRADILSERDYGEEGGSEVREDPPAEVPAVQDPDVKLVNVDDTKLKEVNVAPELQFRNKIEIVRRIIPRNPYKDALINQTCLILNSSEHPGSSLVVYTPHLSSSEQCPFYIPHTLAVGILLHEGVLSVHYIPFDTEADRVLLKDEANRVVRTAYRLLQTSFKHSRGVQQGYEKKVNHDQVVDKVKFQDRYTNLKKRHSKFLVENWVESTDPKKHVFEDIGIAAFLIEFWISTYGDNFKDTVQFRDIGCGNGVLVYILISEGIKGHGIDARHRKSWSIYPQEVKNCLKEKVIVPSVLLRPHPEVRKRMPQLQHNGGMFPVKVAHEVIAPATIVYSSEDLLRSPQVDTAEYPENTFIIGNHSDEMTCWIPLLGFPFVVIPCCSHNLAGERVRYYNKSKRDMAKVKNSTYAGLVAHVEELAKSVGWDVQKEMLRIPSTRNTALIGVHNEKASQFPTREVYDVLLQEGGANGWIQNTMALMKRVPRSH